MASSKNPNETREEFCKRLAGEKLRNKKEIELKRLKSLSINNICCSIRIR